MNNIEITTDMLFELNKNRLSNGIESYIYKLDSDYIYKILKTPNKEELENKLAKIVKLQKLGISFLTTPIATLSYQNEFIGYQMAYDENDLNWSQIDMSKDEKVRYLKQLKDKLFILEEYGILYIDIKKENILINKATGNLKLCDIDSVQIGNLKADMFRYVATYLRGDDLLFDSSIHAFMHNIYTLDVLEDIDSIYFQEDLNILSDIQPLKSFNEQQKPIIENMVKLKKKEICNRYLIDNLR